jgi:iron complex outermembrane receptor protein
MRSTLLLSAAVGSIIAACPAYADTTPPPSPQPAASGSDAGAVGVADIIVTARRRSESLSKVPISITAVSGDTLQARNVVSLQDFTKLAPGLNISLSPAGRVNPFIVIRGQSRSVVGNVSSGVITYVNDVPLPSAGSIVQAYDMADIQVLKGPQGTLFGRNAIGGAVLTNTHAPTYEFGGYARAEAAQYGTYGFEAMLNVPIIQDKVALRIAGQYRKDGTSVKGTVYEPFTIDSIGPSGIVATPGKQILSPRLYPGEFITKSMRVSLLVEPTSWLKNTTVGSYLQSRGVGAPGLSKLYPNGFNNDGQNVALYFQSPENIINTLTPLFGSAAAAGLYASVVQQLAQCPQNTIDCNVFAAQAAYEGKAIPKGFSTVTRDPYNNVGDFKILTNTTVISVSDALQIKNIFGLTRITYHQESSLSGIPIPLYISSGSHIYEEQLSNEFQLSGSLLANQLKYTTGAFYLKERPTGPGGLGSLEGTAFLGLSHTAEGNYLRNTSKALYAQIDYSPDFLTGVTLTAGGRQTWDKQSTCTTTQTFSPFAIGSALAIQNESQTGSVYPSNAACVANSGLAPGAPGYTLSGGTTTQYFPDAEFKKFTYTLGANWQISPEAMVYVAHRRGYRAGGYNVPRLDTFLGAVQTFRPETLTDWEVGTKLRFNAAGMRGSLSFAAFSGKDKGNQLPVTTSNLAFGACVPGAIGSGGRAANCVTAGNAPGVLIATSASNVIVNAADLTIRGIDLDASISPTNWLTLSGGLGYVDVKVDSIAIDPSLTAFLTAAGRPIPNDVIIQGQPKWTLTGTAQVQVPGQVFGGHLAAALDYRYNSSYQAVQLIVPPTTYFDLNVSLDDIGDSGVSLSAYVKNLFNQTIYPGTSGSSPQSLGFASYILASGRTFGMTATLRFGGR